jgi:hypothetical protein
MSETKSETPELGMSYKERLVSGRLLGTRPENTHFKMKQVDDACLRESKEQKRNDQ